MDDIERLQDREYLCSNQYKNSSNLGDRAQLHQRFSDNPVRWHRWIFDFLNLTSGMEVLECGTGPGWLWQENLNQIPEECQITLTDLSPGMVAEAKEKIGTNDARFRFQVADVTSLPFENDSFDRVVANHMLYHVPNSDRVRAFAEIRRTLRPDGCFIATTVGRNHMRELHEFAGQSFSIPVDELRRLSITFTLENGHEQMKPWFTSIELHRYKSTLEVTEAEPILSYILSSSVFGNGTDEVIIQQALMTLEGIISAEGSFSITTDSGLFVARNH
ncbi:MAG: class I SAM-dependent methyltransferase [Candidatus Promineifilaceae bacterium]|nr:class I SAM-dependent methyltransferase [Candidatus Promineifilaceae bacterium]